MIKLVVFDYDGTIVDSFEIVYNIQRKLEKKFNLGIFTSKKALKDIYMTNFYTGIKKKYKKKDLSQYKVECEKLNIQAADKMKVFKNLKQVLRKLKKKYKMVIVSSSFNSVMKKALKKNGIDFFSQILGTEAGESKVEKIKKCIKNFKLKPKEIVYVADTVGDIKEAKKAKVKTIGVTWGYHCKKRLSKAKPNKIINKPQQLIKAVEDL